MNCECGLQMEGAEKQLGMAEVSAEELSFWLGSDEADCLLLLLWVAPSHAVHQPS